MKRLALIALVVLGLALAALAPAIAPQDEEGAFREVSSSVLVCPRLTSAGEASNVVSAMVAEPASGSGTATLSTFQPIEDLVRLGDVGDPVALVSEDETLPATSLQATGAWAPTAFASITSLLRSSQSAGLSSSACVPPAPEWWFVGGGSELGRGAALLVSNPSEEAARFDIALHAGSGPVAALAGKGIDLGPGSSVRLRLDALAPGETLLAIQVNATIGQVAAAVRDVEVPQGDRPRGVDYVPAAAAPSTELVVAGIPGGSGNRELMLVNPGTQFATVEPRVLTDTGTEELPELSSLAVPAGAVIKVDLDRVLAGRASSLAMTSDVPITGGARAEYGARSRDVVWLSAVPPIADPNPMAAAAAVPAVTGLRTSVVIAAAESEVTGTLAVTSVPTDDVASLGQADPPASRGAEVVLPGDAARTSVQEIVVPAGSQQAFALPAPEGDSELAAIVWRSQPGSGPAAVTHVVLDEENSLATGYSWWPVRSSVESVAIREDFGVLVPTEPGS